MQFVIDDNTIVEQLARFIATYTEDGEPNPILFMDAVKLAYRIKWGDEDAVDYIARDTFDHEILSGDEPVIDAG